MYAPSHANLIAPFVGADGSNGAQWPFGGVVNGCGRQEHAYRSEYQKRQWVPEVQVVKEVG